MVLLRWKLLLYYQRLSLWYHSRWQRLRIMTIYLPRQHKPVSCNQAWGISRGLAVPQIWRESRGEYAWIRGAISLISRCWGHGKWFTLNNTQHGLNGWSLMLYFFGYEHNSCSLNATFLIASLCHTAFKVWPWILLRLFMLVCFSTICFTLHLLIAIALFSICVRVSFFCSSTSSTILGRGLAACLAPFSATAKSFYSSIRLISYPEVLQYIASSCNLDRHSFSVDVSARIFSPIYLNVNGNHGK